MNNDDRPVAVDLLEFFTTFKTEGSITALAVKLEKHLIEKFQCSRYLCIYYNTKARTHLEFNLLPHTFHVPQVPPHNHSRPCFRNNAVPKCPGPLCNSARCSNFSADFGVNGHDEKLRKGIIERWDDHQETIKESPLPFWFDYELFLHHKFDPFKEGVSHDSADETILFSILKDQEEENEFFKKYSMFKGEDNWFDSNDFSLLNYNKCNGLGTQFYGCYLIPPLHTQHPEHAAVLMAYVDHSAYEEKGSQGEVQAAVELLGFLAQLCWPTLNREILRDMEKIQEEQSRLERNDQIYREIETDLRDLTSQITKLRRSTLRIEGALNVVGDTFLQHGPDLEPLFLTNVKLWYSVETKGDGHVGKPCVSAPLRSCGDSVSGLQWFEINAIHSGIKKAQWENLRLFLERYADDRTDMKLLKKIAEKDEHGTLRFELLKLMFHRPHHDPSRIFTAQVGLALATVLDDRSPISIGDLIPKVGGLDILDEIIINEIKPQAFAVANCCNVLSSLMRLAKYHLMPNSSDNEKVQLFEVNIEPSDNRLNIILSCENIFPSPAKNLFDREHADHHDLAGTIHLLLRAINAPAPIFLEQSKTEVLEILQKFSPPRVIISTDSGGSKTYFFFSIPLSQE